MLFWVSALFQRVSPRRGAILPEFCRRSPKIYRLKWGKPPEFCPNFAEFFRRCPNDRAKIRCLAGLSAISSDPSRPQKYARKYRLYWFCCCGSMSCAKSGTKSGTKHEILPPLPWCDRVEVLGGPGRYPGTWSIPGDPRCSALHHLADPRSLVDIREPGRSLAILGVVVLV